MLSAVATAFLVYTYLEPLFVPVGSNTAMVFLDILTINGALVGMALGVMLPSLFSGICLGAMIALMGGSFFVVSNNLYFPSVACALALVLAGISAR